MQYFNAKIRNPITRRYFLLGNIFRIINYFLSLKNTNLKKVFIYFNQTIGLLQFVKQ